MTFPLFYGTSGPRDARCAVVGHIWGKNEVAKQRPFEGESGALFRRLLGLAGIDYDACFVTNIWPRQPSPDVTQFFHPAKEKKPKLRGLALREEYRDDLSRLHQELAAVRPAVIVALGDYPLWALTDRDFRVRAKEGYHTPTGVGARRGSRLCYNAPERSPGCDGIPLIPTYHPAAVMRNWPVLNDTVHDLKVRVKPIMEGRDMPPITRRFIIRPTFAQVMDALDTIMRLHSGAYVTTDVETFARNIDCIGLAWSTQDAICIPFFSKFSAEPYWTGTEEQVIRARLRKVYRRTDLRWSNQNINYDLQHLAFNLLDPPFPACDTMVGQHVLFPGTPKDLSQLASLHCQEYRYWGESDDCSTDEERWIYNCWDVAYTWEISFSVIAALCSTNMLHLFQRRMEILWEVAFDMMLRGIRIDQTARLDLVFGDLMNGGSGGVLAAIQAHENYLRAIMPEWVPPLLRGPSAKSEWFNSNDQLANLFYQRMQCKKHFDRKTKALTVDDDALEKIKLEKPILEPMISTIQELRTMGKVYGFLTGKLSPDGRMRSSFNVAGPVSFRWASKEDAFGEGDNIQNIIKEKGDE